MIYKAEPTLGPWSLKLVDITDEIKHSLAVTTYPYQNGADVEDMGVEPEVLHFSCKIINDDYDNNYYHIRNWFRSKFPEPVELVHPHHGVIYGYPGNASFAENKENRSASFTFEFTVAEIQPESQAVADPYENAIEETETLNYEVAVAVADEMQKAGVPDVPGSDDWSLLDKWGEMGDAARAFAEATSRAVGQIMGVIESVQAPIDAISTTIDYVESLSGVLTNRMQKCCDAFVGLSRKFTGKSKASVSVLVESATSMLTRLSSAPTVVRAGFASLAASTVATETAKIISEDEKHLAESIADESSVADDAEGRPLVSKATPVFITPADLEDSLAMVRRFINDVLPYAIGTDHLKKQAALLSDSVLRIKLEYMTTTTVNLTEDTPVHKITLDNKLPYMAADRICALNNVKNPNFIHGEVRIYGT